MDPAGQRDNLPDVSRAQFVAMVRAFHLIRWSSSFSLLRSDSSRQTS
jgi:hypothetical protein